MAEATTPLDGGSGNAVQPHELSQEYQELEIDVSNVADSHHSNLGSQADPIGNLQYEDVAPCDSEESVASYHSDGKFRSSLRHAR